MGRRDSLADQGHRSWEYARINAAPASISWRHIFSCWVVEVIRI
jgi:hypothetical protein